MYSIKVVEAVPLDNMEILVSFENGKIKRFDVKSLLPDNPEFEALRNPDIFNLLKVEPGGYGISWNEDLDCSEGELYDNGTDVSTAMTDLLCLKSDIQNYEAKIVNAGIEDLKKGRLKDGKTVMDAMQIKYGL